MKVVNGIVTYHLNVPLDGVYRLIRNGFKIVGVNSTFPTTNTGSRYQELKNNKSIQYSSHSLVIK